MVWPNQFLLVVLVSGLLSILVPWVIPRCRHAVLLRLTPALLTAACWFAYETQLLSMAQPGDPLIRIDLLVIIPVLAAASLSTLGAIVFKRSHAPGV
jgi:hypothetical protein